MAYAPSKSKKNPAGQAEMPNLTTMMDMMTIILLFLLKSLAVSGALLHAAPGIELPVSQNAQEAQQHLSFIINDYGIFEDLEGQIGNKLVSPEDMNNDSIQIFGGFVDFLQDARQQDLLLKREVRTIITLQGDARVKYKYIYKFIQSCGYSGFETVQFIVEKNNQAGG